MAKFEGYAAHDWPLDAQIDRTLLVQIIKSLIREMDRLRWVYRIPARGGE